MGCSLGQEKKLHVDHMDDLSSQGLRHLPMDCWRIRDSACEQPFKIEFFRKIFFNYSFSKNRSSKWPAKEMYAGAV